MPSTRSKRVNPPNGYVVVAVVNVVAVVVVVNVLLLVCVSVNADGQLQFPYFFPFIFTKIQGT